jgi:hypothetical protein
MGTSDSLTQMVDVAALRTMVAKPKRASKVSRLSSRAAQGSPADGVWTKHQSVDSAA